MVLMIIFTIFKGLSALSPDYYTMMITRFLSGLPHGIFLGLGNVVAVKFAKEGKQAKTIAMMFSGLATTNLAMVPLVTFIGHHLSWPIKSIPTPSLKDDLRFFKSKKELNIIAITAIGFGGLLAWFSYSLLILRILVVFLKIQFLTL